MKSTVLFFEAFFASNSKDVGNAFLHEMQVPEDIEQLIREYYVEKIPQKIMADMHHCDERTLREKLANARQVVRIKAVGWFSNYFSNILKNTYAQPMNNNQ